MPPLSGFLGKLLVMDAARDSDLVWWIWGVILVTSLISMVGFARAGSTVFWKTAPVPVAPELDRRPAERQDGPAALSFVAVGVIVAGLVLATVFAGPLTVYLTATADQLYAPEGYIRAVLGGG
jgi:multicomponent K+:H+ antiporter subunit D